VREDWGTADEYFDTLFEHFLRIDESPNRQFGGTRLGLVICNELAGLMGGRIGVRSETGISSTFFLVYGSV